MILRTERMTLEPWMITIPKICCALPSLRLMFIVLYAYDFHLTSCSCGSSVTCHPPHNWVTTLLKRNWLHVTNVTSQPCMQCAVRALQGARDMYNASNTSGKKLSWLCVSLVPSVIVTSSTWKQKNTASQSRTLNRPLRHTAMAMLPYSQRSPPDSILLSGQIGLEHARSGT